ncbi:predicted sugar kinase [Sanguibacter keddieii DSM 10542]|uniref:Bifunctional NAD(P)H-hydrate repair enzyme n=1 Tax=Sanguibacter keddieii (strain ATCC 51767 / DSM 10542 / NCFB 3025 / ST-74) TaxID=446469 RepID=D1BBQ8_SANKS|nr:bifunctional ADP-dependent NAD(P)H-hydrate dehydratase/NAD(P)H-hydrate epimerase [Sanguibacter keddieii]ACZ22829.1 predicted sugar kinase [Sanguibacter keddieii DSM 10542]
MIEAHDARSVRAAEEPLLARGEPLMQRASWALAGVVLRELRSRRESSDGASAGAGAGARAGLGARRAGVRGATARLLVGSGNNGGDTLFAGARLAARGVQVSAVLLDDRVHPAGLAALRAAGGRVVHASGRTVDEVARHVVAADVVLDGILGIGASGGLRGLAADVVAAVVDRLDRLGRDDLGGAVAPRPLVVAVDVPSGTGVDDGTLPPVTAARTVPTGRSVVLRADRTVTFGAAKPGLLLPPAAALAGEVEVVDLGLGLSTGRPRRDDHVERTLRPGAVRRLEPADLVRLGVVAEPSGASHKYTRGVLGVVAGTERFPGAAVLTVSGAVRTGIGMVRYLGDPSVTTAVLAARPEVVPAAGRVQAWAVGSGIPAAPSSADDPARSQRTRVRHALAQATGELSSDVVGDAVPVVVDAGALPLLPDRCPPWVVLTPHAGELAELLRSRGDQVERAEVEAEPLRWARRARDLTGATVLLKGAVTVVVGPTGAYAQADGPSWLSTAGAGDVLTGVLGSLLAAHSVDAVKDPGLPALLAASAALLHGRAAHRANPGGPVAALDVADALPGTVAELLRRRG